MAYVIGDLISATDYNNFVTAANNLWGVGTGNRGYGQIGSILTPIATNKLVEGAEWDALRDVISKLEIHQKNANSSDLPAASNFVVNENIKAIAGNPGFDSFARALSTVEANRLLVDVTNITSTQLHLTTRATNWGVTGTSETIVEEVEYVFASENEARYFFNTGGVISLDFDRFGGPTNNQNSGWTSIFNAVGKINIDYTGIYSSTGAGTASAVDYFTLSATDSIVYTYSTTFGPYSGNSVDVYARVANVAGVNGGNGDRIIVRVELTDTFTLSNDIVSGTLQCEHRVNYANGGPVTVAPPTINILQTFA